MGTTYKVMMGKMNINQIGFKFVSNSIQCEESNITGRWWVDVSSHGSVVSDPLFRGSDQIINI